jgi:hypothetical protein
MTIGEVLLAIITGLVVNECCDVSPWIARKLVRWSARRRYAPPSRAKLRAEELAAYIDDRPGKLFKLITALGFVAAAIVTRKIAPDIAPPIPLWWPTTPTVPVYYEETDDPRHPNARAMRQSWYQLTDEVRHAARELGMDSRSWRRCIKELRRITGDDRWTLVARNLDLLEEINKSCANSNPKDHPGGIRHRIYRWSYPTDSTITRYQAAVETARAEIRRLTCDFQ